MCYLRRFIPERLVAIATLLRRKFTVMKMKELTRGIRSPLKRISELRPLIRWPVHQVVGHGFFSGLIISCVSGCLLLVASKRRRQQVRMTARTHARNQARTQARIHGYTHTNETLHYATRRSVLVLMMLLLLLLMLLLLPPLRWSRENSPSS